VPLEEWQGRVGAPWRFAATQTRIWGVSDHGTHEAVYLPDPCGCGIELATVASEAPDEVLNEASCAAIRGNEAHRLHLRLNARSTIL